MLRPTSRVVDLRDPALNQIYNMGAAARARPAGQARQALLDRIDRAIEPFDVSGLLDPARRDWFPVLASDLIRSAAKLETPADQIASLLRRIGFEPS